RPQRTDPQKQRRPAEVAFGGVGQKAQREGQVTSSRRARRRSFRNTTPSPDSSSRTHGISGSSPPAHFRSPALPASRFRRSDTVRRSRAAAKGSCPRTRLI